MNAETTNSRPTPLAAADQHSADGLSREIDALSLRQALLDFEMANARVLDLTARLVESHARVVKLQAELDGVGTTVERVRADGETARLELIAELERLRAHAAALESIRAEAEAAAAREHAELVALRSSTTFRLARSVGRVVNRIRR